VTSARNPRIARVNALFRWAARTMPDRAVYIPIADVVCRGQSFCPAAAGGQLIRYDGVHYTDSFSRSLAAIVVGRAQRAGVVFGDPRAAHAATGSATLADIGGSQALKLTQ
jgi:hypothetical protein